MSQTIVTSKPSTSWERNLAVIWFAEVVAVAGFTVVMPLLPLYVRELGVQGEGNQEERRDAESGDGPSKRLPALKPASPNVDHLRSLPLLGNRPAGRVLTGRGSRPGSP